ncbi:MAG: DUF1015 domain-containing protein [Comamonadaceae bacterium]|nr:DUF1015 domain-containing protein [Comamonadaceae bacterium]
MSLIRPFAGLRPVAGPRRRGRRRPPYDVLSTDEARALRRRQAVELPAHLQARDRPAAGHRPLRAARSTPRRAENLDRMLAAGRAGAGRGSPATTSTAWSWASHVQTGLVAAASVADYDANRIRKPRVHPPGQGGRPGAPDRGAQRPDRPGAAGLPAPRPRSTRMLGRGAAGSAGRRRRPPTTACATRSG